MINCARTNRRHATANRYATALEKIEIAKWDSYTFNESARDPEAETLTLAYGTARDYAAELAQEFRDGSDPWFRML